MRQLAIVVVAGLALAASAGEPMSQRAACQKRFVALCAVMQRCSVAAEDLGKDCQAIDSGCAELSGAARYDAAAIDACVSGLETLTCAKKVDPNDASAMDFESKVAACRALAAADVERSATARR